MRHMGVSSSSRAWTGGAAKRKQPQPPLPFPRAMTTKGEWTISKDARALDRARNTHLDFLLCRSSKEPLTRSGSCGKSRQQQRAKPWKCWKRYCASDLVLLKMDPEDESGRAEMLFRSGCSVQFYSSKRLSFHRPYRVLMLVLPGTDELRNLHSRTQTAPYSALAHTNILPCVRSQTVTAQDEAVFMRLRDETARTASSLGMLDIFVRSTAAASFHSEPWNRVDPLGPLTCNGQVGCSCPRR